MCTAPAPHITSTSRPFLSPLSQGNGQWHRRCSVRALNTTTQDPGLIALRVLRAPQWAYFAVLPLAAATTLEPARLTLSFLAAAAALAFSYGLNAVAERHTDVSATKNPLVGLTALPRAVTLSLASCVSLALTLAAALGLPSLVAIAVSLIAGTLYSVGPRLKAWPLAGLVANTLIFVPLLVIGVSGRTLPAAFPDTMWVFTALLLQNQLAHELGDAREDEAAGALTTARALGARVTRALMVCIALVAAVVTGHFVALALPTLTTLLPLDWSTRRRAHRLASIAVGAALFFLGRAS